jgi:beta-glucosidase
LQGAREGAVLLKNAGAILPLDKNTVKSILVVGPDAYPAVPVGGGSAGVVPFRSTGAFLGLADELGQGATVFYDRGVPKMNDIVNGTTWRTSSSKGTEGVKLETFANPDLSGSPTRSTVPHMKLEGLSIKLLMDDIENAMALFSWPLLRRRRIA